MAEMTLEVKAPQDAIDIIPQERITGDILRGHGPRRGNLEALIKYWRPIMRKPGGFRRCIIILANHPELYPLQPLCAWLHHETTGQWPNEGNHHEGGKLGPVLRVARRAIPGKRKRRSRKSDDCGVEIASWRLYRRWSREIKGVTTRPINGDQNAVEYKAARFMAGTKSVPVPGSFDWDENHTPRDLTIYEKVGLVNSHGRLGRALQSLASYFIPGDMSKLRNPGRSALYGALTPGGGGGRGRGGGLGSIGGSALRCPSGYLNGGRFADPKLTNCGGLILDAPAKGPGAVTAVDRDKMKRRFQRGDDLPSVARDVAANTPEGDPFAVIRQAATAPKSKPDVKRRDSAVKDVAEYAKKNPNTTRVVRRDGVVYEPRVGPEELVRIKDHDAFKDAAWVTSKIPRSGGLAGDEVRLLTKGVKSVNYVFPDGTVKVERKGEIPAGVAANMRTRWAAISRDPDVKINPVLSLERWVTEFKNEVELKYSGKIKNGNERIVVYDVAGMRRVVQRWVFQLYLSERAPRRMGNKKPHYLAKPQIDERGRRPEGKDLRPERNRYVASFVQQKALAKYVSPLPVRDQSLSLIRISGTTGLSKDSLVEMKAAFFNRSVASSDISVKVFGRRRRGLGRISSAARRMPKVVPYNRHARDGDIDGLVQEGTIWERPKGAVFRGIAEGARRLVSSAILEDSNGSRIDYKPGDHERSPLRQMSRGQARRAGRVDRAAVGQEGRISDRDRRLIAEGEAVDRGEVDESIDRVRRRVLRAMGSPERRRARAGRHRERADRDVARAQSDIERADQLRRLREDRDAFDREVVELDERHREEREGLMERDPRNQRRRDRRQRRRGEPEAGEEEEEAEPARERTGLLEGFARRREEAIRRRDEREGAEVDFSERDRRRAERSQRREERLRRFAEGQDEAVEDRDRELDAQVDREEVDGIIDRLTRPLRQFFEKRGFKERSEEDEQEVIDRTGHSVGEHIEALDGRDATILDPTPDEEARDVQDLIEAVRIEDDGSLPDDRSLRNVGNRFPRHGLPERAFWRDDDYEPGGGRDVVEQRELHERRFGRYFDGEGDINDRGLLVNKQLEEQRAAAEAPDAPESLPPDDIRDISEVMAEAYPNRPEDMSQEAIRAEIAALDAAHPDILERPFLETRRGDELEAALKPADGDRLSVEQIQKVVDRFNSPAEPGERRADRERLVAAAEDLLTREEWDDDMRAEAVLLMNHMPPPNQLDDAENPGIYHRLRSRELQERQTRGPGTPDAPEQATTTPPTPDVPAADTNSAGERIDAVSVAERPAQRQVERVRAAIIEQLGEEAWQQVVNDWPEMEAQYDRDGAGERLLYPIRSAVDWQRPVEQSIENPADIFLGAEIWGDDPPVVDADASMATILVAVRAKLATLEGDHTDGLAILRTRLEGINPTPEGNYQVSWNDLAVRRRSEWEAAGRPTSGDMLEGRILTQMLRHLQDQGMNRGAGEGRLGALNEILQVLDNWDRNAIRRGNPVNQPGVPDADLPWLQSVSQAIMGRRMNKIRAVAGERAARHGRPARFGLEAFGIERSWFESGSNLTAERKSRILEMLTEAYSLGVENRFTAPGNLDAEFMIASSARGDVPTISLSKHGDQIDAGFSSSIYMRKRNADGTWGAWDSTGSTSRSIYMKGDGSGHISNGTMYNRGAKGQGFATVYNNYAWASLIETGLVKKVVVGPAEDGPVIWGRHGFDDRTAAKGMVHFLTKAVEKFDAGEDSILLSQNMRDDAERLVGAYHRDPANVTSMMGHSILQTEGRHPWERQNGAGVALADDDFPGAVGTKYGQWWKSRETEGGVTYSPATSSSDFIISESELARIFGETIASIRVDAEQLPEADRPRSPTPENPASVVGVPNRPGLEIDLADDYPDRPEGLTDAVLDAEINAIRAAHNPDRRPFLPGQRLIELEAELERRARRADAPEGRYEEESAALRRISGVRYANRAALVSQAVDGVNQAMEGRDESRALMILLDAPEGILDPIMESVAADDEDRIGQLADALFNAPDGSVVGQHPRANAVLAALRNRRERRNVDSDDPDRIIMEGITTQILQGVDGDINEQEREIQRFVQAAAEEPDTELERLERLDVVVQSAVAVNDGFAHNRLRRAYQARLNQLRNDAAVRRRDSIAAMSHQEMWAEMASMRSRWNDRALINMPDEIRERYEALVDAYDRAAPAGARRPDALGRSVV
jgi:hypothetical protein